MLLFIDCFRFPGRDRAGNLADVLPIAAVCDKGSHPLIKDVKAKKRGVYDYQFIE